MDIKTILNEGTEAELSQEEIGVLTTSFIKEIETLKETNPVEYLKLVNQVNKSLKELNATLRKVV